jgi:hypothetical protein
MAGNRLISGGIMNEEKRILVDRARRHNIKRGRGLQHVLLDETAVIANDPL